MAYNLGLVVWVLRLSIRYEEKRWVPRDGKAKLAPRVSEEKASKFKPIAESISHYGYAKKNECFPKEQNSTHPSSANNSTLQKVDKYLFIF